MSIFSPITITIPQKKIEKISNFFSLNIAWSLFGFLTSISVAAFIFFYQDKLGLSYNDARSHLDIGRRVVEGLTTGLAQLGSVWLPLPHILMIPTVWNDFFWHSGLSGSLQSMAGYIGTGILIYLFLKKIGVGMLGRLAGVFVFAANINVLYLQSTAMTELILLFVMTAGMYELLKWHTEENLISLIKGSFWIMLATLVRYEGWFLLIMTSVFIFIDTARKKGIRKGVSYVILFTTLAGFGIFLWLLWNALIFKDPLYFALGPFSAHAQQKQLAEAGVLVTKGNLLLSLKIYLHALMYNSYTFITFVALCGYILMLLDRKFSPSIKLASTLLWAPFIFNILALYLGFSVLFVQGISGNTWFNVRYGIMMMPAIAIFSGYLLDKLKSLRIVIIGLWLFVIAFAFLNTDAVTIDDARVGSSQKNVSEVSGWLAQHAKNSPGFILISAASHDAIIFSSGLPMKRFIHEGTGSYWKSATTAPDRWARWIIMRTYDDNDLTWKNVSRSSGFAAYQKIKSFPFADIYEIKPEYIPQLATETSVEKEKDI